MADERIGSPPNYSTAVLAGRSHLNSCAERCNVLQTGLKFPSQKWISGHVLDGPPQLDQRPSVETRGTSVLGSP